MTEAPTSRLEGNPVKTFAFRGFVVLSDPRFLDLDERRRNLEATLRQ